jgi:hypothetical protein
MGAGCPQTTKVNEVKPLKMLIRPRAVVAVGLLVIAGIFAAYYWPQPVTSLPHRPLHEIDIQGHQPIVAPGDDQCPGRYTYGAYGTTILTCWGVR